ncbi:recombinase family protein [Streptomyces antibioticus]
MVERPKRAALYCRLSYAPDGSLEKVERQEADCRELAQRLGWAVSERHVFVDNSRSAWQRKRKRPQWDRLLTAVDAGEIDAIIVYHGDRMIRQPFDLERLIGLAENKGLRIASPSGTRDLDSPDDRFILRIEAAQACRESDNISRRVTRGVKARAGKGLPGTAGGRRPFGWGVQTGTRTRVGPDGQEREVPAYDTTKPVPGEVRLIQQAIKRQLAGMSHGAVVRWLNAQGATTTEGNPWTPKAWRNVALSPRVAGLVEHDGQLYPAVWKGAVSVDVWEAVKALYTASAQKRPYPGRERVHLLTGRAECFQCHKGPKAACTGDACRGPHHTVRSKPTGGRNRKDSRIYFCPECRGIGRNLELLDAYVDGRVLRLLSDEAFAQELHAAAEAENATDLVTQITALEKRRDKTKADVEALADNPEVDLTLALQAVASFDRKIAELRSQMRMPVQVQRLQRVAGISRSEWRALPVDVRSTVVSDLFRIVILPTSQRGPGFDPSSVRLERRPLGSPDRGSQRSGERRE